jgi:GNAT superfamily N-acetyltransferase
MTIRPAIAEDAPVVAEFNRRLARETEGRELDADTVAAGVRALLEDPAKGRYFVAVEAGEIIGQIMHTHEWSDWRNGDIWWIQSVYVRADRRGQGVFTGLFRHLEALARADRGVRALRLYVERNNAAAQAVYRKLGLHGGEYEVMEIDFTSLSRAGADGAPGEP